VSLRKSPTRTPALLAANRRNAQKSTGPRTRSGKAWSRLNPLKEGRQSREHVNFITALMNARPGRVGAVANALLSAQEVHHPLFLETADLAVRIEFEMCTGRRVDRLFEA
jgi:hypothetical protein